jgi:hypothetical protein
MLVGPIMLLIIVPALKIVFESSKTKAAQKVESK